MSDIWDRRTEEYAKRFFATHPPGSYTQEEFEREFGLPPYEFLDDADPIPRKSKSRKRPNNLLDPEYQAKYSYPNYRNFVPEYIDQKGRQYQLARSNQWKDALVRTGDIRRPDFDDPPLYTETGGRGNGQMFYVRIPIKLSRPGSDDKLQWPDAEGERIELFNIDSQVIASGTTDGLFFGPKSKTGRMVLKNFETFGVAPDPAPYVEIVNRSIGEDSEQKKNKRKKK
jgi:hypothetical protein